VCGSIDIEISVNPASYLPAIKLVVTGHNVKLRTILPKADLTSARLEVPARRLALATQGSACCHLSSRFDNVRQRPVVLAKRRPRRLRKNKRVSEQTDSCARYALVAVERLVGMHATPPFFLERPVTERFVELRTPDGWRVYISIQKGEVSVEAGVSKYSLTHSAHSFTLSCPFDTMVSFTALFAIISSLTTLARAAPLGKLCSAHTYSI
jgi:hypothetical protein